MLFSVGYGRLRQPLSVVRLLDQARSARVELDIVAWNSAVDALVRCGQIRDAHKLIKGQFFPTTASSNSPLFGRNEKKERKKKWGSLSNPVVAVDVLFRFRTELGDCG